MPTSVCIVENPEVSSAIDIGPAFERARLNVVKRTSWAAFHPEQLRGQRASLLFANALQGAAGAEGLFAWLLAHPLDAPTFAIVPADDAPLIRLAAAAVDGFVVWPAPEDELYHRLTRLVGPPARSRDEIQSSLIGQLGLQRLVGEAPAFLDVLTRISQYCSSDAAILLTGETGTGKELCARAIHMLSRRHNGPFIPVECGSIPEHLFENEVFGHTRGAFTDARSDQKGLVALARGGTLFLDEIDSLSLAIQGKLLRLLQEQMFRPLGSDQFCDADLRVVAATNCDLATLVQQKRFRSDLFFRLDVLRLHLPALRERRSDVALLARHFLAEICAKDGIPHKTLTPAAIRKLESHSWPGNIRELHHAVHRAALSARGNEIAPIHIGMGEERASADSLDDSGKPALTFRIEKRRAIESFERSYVQRMMAECNGNVTRAAHEAGKDRRAFGRLAKKYTQNSI
jgi:DNA-binding NtrC family response regulator